MHISAVCWFALRAKSGPSQRDARRVSPSLGLTAAARVPLLIIKLTPPVRGASLAPSVGGAGGRRLAPDGPGASATQTPPHRPAASFLYAVLVLAALDADDGQAEVARPADQAAERRSIGDVA